MSYSELLKQIQANQNATVNDLATAAVQTAEIQNSINETVFKELDSIKEGLGSIDMKQQSGTIMYPIVPNIVEYAIKMRLKKDDNGAFVYPTHKVDDKEVNKTPKELAFSDFVSTSEDNKTTWINVLLKDRAKFESFDFSAIEKNVSIFAGSTMYEGIQASFENLYMNANTKQNFELAGKFTGAIVIVNLGADYPSLINEKYAPTTEETVFFNEIELQNFASSLDKVRAQYYARYKRDEKSKGKVIKVHDDAKHLTFWSDAEKGEAKKVIPTPETSKN